MLIENITPEGEYWQADKSKALTSDKRLIEIKHSNMVSLAESIFNERASLSGHEINKCKTTLTSHNLLYLEQGGLENVTPFKSRQTSGCSPTGLPSTWG